MRHTLFTLLSIILGILLILPAYAGTVPKASGKPLMEETDGSPSSRPYKVIWPNTSLTDNSDGTVTVNLSAGSTFDGLSDTTFAGLASGDLAIYDGVNSWDNKVLSGDATLASTGAITLVAGISRDTEWDTEAEVQTAWAGANIIVATEIDTYSELDTIVADATLTHNGLIDTFAELDAIVADVALVNPAAVPNLTFTTGSAIRTGVTAANTLLLQAYDVDGTAYTTFATFTAANTPTVDLSSSVTIGGQNIVDQTEIDTYAELDTIVADVTLTHNGLIDTYAEVNAIVADVTLTHNGLIDTFAELDAIVADKSLVNTADNFTFAGQITLSSAQDITFSTAKALRTGTTATNTLLLNAYDVDGASYTTFVTLTAANTPTMDLSSSVTIGGNNIVDQLEIDTYAELNTIVADVTLTHNGLIDTYAELNTIVADVTLKHNGLIDTFAE